jgi:hypothetical protein
MRILGSLPSDVDLLGPPNGWFKSVQLQIPDHMIGITLQVSWRVWFARNEVTHTSAIDRRG